MTFDALLNLNYISLIISSQHERKVQPPIMYFAGLLTHDGVSLSHLVSVQVRITKS
jgi:hypothetical protein